MDEIRREVYDALRIKNRAESGSSRFRNRYRRVKERVGLRISVEAANNRRLKMKGSERKCR